MRFTRDTTSAVESTYFVYEGETLVGRVWQTWQRLGGTCWTGTATGELNARGWYPTRQAAAQAVSTRFARTTTREEQ